MTRRPPGIGDPVAVRFPAIARDVLGNGLAVWSIPRATAPAAAVLLVVNCGTSHDPADRPGLAGVAADLADEGAAGRDAIGLSEAFARLGSHLEIEVGPDVTTFGLTVLSRHVDAALDLLGDVLLRPTLDAGDFERVRELRTSRLRQLSRSAGSAADRTFLDAVFGAHPYGHGALGTTTSLGALSVDDARAFWHQGFAPGGATLIMAGDVTHAGATGAARRVFATWAGTGLGRVAAPDGLAPPDRRILLVDRPGSSQSELRVGHSGPPRQNDAYHALITMNAILGGQFASRINHSLRETRGVTYGARTAFEFRRAGGSYACETSVQADATGASVAEILDQFEAIRQPGSIAGDELARARSSLTRGYVRNFETPVQLARAAAQMAVHDLPPDTYDAFVPQVTAITPAQATDAARRFVHPADSVVVVVGDAATCRPQLDGLGRDVVTVMPEF